MAQPTYARVGKSFYIYSGGKWNPYQLKNPANAGKIKGFKSLGSASQYYGMGLQPTAATAQPVPAPLDYRAKAAEIYNPIYAPQEQQINTLYDTEQQDLQRRLQTEYARRGILSSGLYGEEYGRGQTALATQKTGDLAKLLGEKTGAIDKYVLEQQQAEADRQLAEQKAASEAADRAFKQKLQQLQLRRAGVGLQAAQTKAITTGRKLATGRGTSGRATSRAVSATSGGYTNSELKKLRAASINPKNIKAADKFLYSKKGKSDTQMQLAFASYADTILGKLRTGKMMWGAAYRAMKAKFPTAKGAAIDAVLNKKFWGVGKAYSRYIFRGNKE